MCYRVPRSATTLPPTSLRFWRRRVKRSPLLRFRSNRLDLGQVSLSPLDLRCGPRRAVGAAERVELGIRPRSFRWIRDPLLVGGPRAELSDGRGTLTFA